MSNPGELRHFPVVTTTSSSSTVPLEHRIPATTADPSIALHNLSQVQTRVDAVRNFLSDSVNTRTLIGKQQMEFLSTQIATSIHQIIVNGATLIASSQSPIVPTPLPTQIPMHSSTSTIQTSDSIRNVSISNLKDLNYENPACKLEIDEVNSSDDWQTIELGSEELLAEHSHFCDICGKGFKRDANLRMHMRAHGNQFKTPEALAKPEKFHDLETKKIRFSCPWMDCNRNKSHVKFKPFKTVISVKSHFKRSHCPKMYLCNKCNKKSFSVMTDLRNHLMHCGETKWKCLCGTSFSRKDKLFGHMTLFEGHMPAIMEEDGKGKEAMMAEDDEEEVMEEKESRMDVSDSGGFDGLTGDYGSIEDYCLEDMLNTPKDSSLATDMDEFFDF